MDESGVPSGGSITFHRFIPSIAGKELEQFYGERLVRLSKEQLEQLNNDITTYIITNTPDSLKDDNILFWITIVLVRAIEDKEADVLSNILINVKLLINQIPGKLSQFFNEVANVGPFNGRTYAHTWVHQYITIIEGGDLASFISLEWAIEQLMNYSEAGFIDALCHVVTGSKYTAGSSGVSSMVFALSDSASDPLNQVMTLNLAKFLKLICEKSSRVKTLLLDQSYLTGMSLMIDLCEILQPSVKNNDGLTEILCDIMENVIQDSSPGQTTMWKEQFYNLITYGKYKDYSNFQFILKGLLFAASQPEAKAEKQFNAIFNLVDLLTKEMPADCSQSLFLKRYEHTSEGRTSGLNSLFLILFFTITNHYEIEKMAKYINQMIIKIGIEDVLNSFEACDLTNTQWMKLYNSIPIFQQQHESLVQLLIKKYSLMKENYVFNENENQEINEAHATKNTNISPNRFFDHEQDKFNEEIIDIIKFTRTGS